MSRLPETVLQFGTGKFLRAFADLFIHQANQAGQDVGRVAAIDEAARELAVDFDGRPVPYDFGELDELSLAYAMTTHKAQGSEYPAVVIPLHTQHYVMLQRNLLYTGVTRGKRLVVLVGSRKALEMAVLQQDTARRCSMLKVRLLNESGRRAKDLDRSRREGGPPVEEAPPRRGGSE